MATWYDGDPQRLNAEVCIMRAYSRAVLREDEGTLFWLEDIVSQRKRRRYRLMVAYPTRFPYARPIAHIVTPTIRVAPHRFIDGSLCLFNSPSACDVKITALVVRNRAAAWLFAYEIWLDTGVWKAPEHRA